MLNIVKKGEYLAPEIEVMEVLSSEMLCVSGDVEELNPVDPWAN